MTIAWIVFMIGVFAWLYTIMGTALQLFYEIMLEMLKR